MSFTTNQLRDVLDWRENGLGPLGMSFEEWDGEWHRFCDQLDGESIGSLLPIMASIPIEEHFVDSSSPRLLDIYAMLRNIGWHADDVYFEVADSCQSDHNLLAFFIQTAISVNYVRGREWVLGLGGLSQGIMNLIQERLQESE